MLRWNLDPHRLSVSTRALSRDFRAAVEAAARAGFAAIEVWSEDTAQVGGPHAAARLASDCGLRIASWQVGRDLDGVPPEVFAPARETMKRLVGECAGVSAGNVLFCSSMRDDAADDFRLAVDQVAIVARDAEEAGVTIAFEALSMGARRRRWTEAWALVQAVDHPALGLAVDTTHCALTGDDVGPIAEVPVEKLAFVQLADLASLEGDLLEINRRRRLFPGEGDLDFEPFMAAVNATGYDGYVSLEVFNAANLELPAADNARRAMASFRRS